MLLHGDEFRVRGASRAILGLIAPEPDRGLSTSTFDGRSASWDEVEAALMAPSLFVSCLHGGGGKRSLVRPRGAQGRSAGQVSESLGGGATRRRRTRVHGAAAVGRVDAGAVAGGGRRVGIGGHPQGLPGACAGDPGALAVLPRAEPGSRKFQGRRAWAASSNSWSGGCRPGPAFSCWRPRWTSAGASTSNWAARAAFSTCRWSGTGADASAASPSPRFSTSDSGGRASESIRSAREAVLSRCGNELWAVHQEIEKLLLYVGDADTVGVADVEEIFIDQSESWVFEPDGFAGAEGRAPGPGLSQAPHGQR